MKSGISGHITAQVVAYLRGRGGDPGALAREAGLSLDRLSDIDAWFTDAEVARLLETAHRLHPTWNVSYEVGVGLLSSGLADLRDTSLIFRESPLQLISLFAERYVQFHRSVEFDVVADGPRGATLGLAFSDRTEASQEFAELLEGMVRSIPRLVELRDYKLSKTSCSLPPTKLKRIKGRMVRVAPSGEVLEYPEVSGKRRLGGRVIGRVAPDGTFVHDGVRYGERRMVYSLTWKKPRLIGRLTGLTAREKLRDLTARFDRAKEAIGAANQRITVQERELSDTKRLVDAISRFVTEAKGAGSLLELMSLASTHACEGYGVDRAAIFLIRGERLEPVSFYDPSDPSAAQRVYAALTHRTLPLDGDTLEADVARSGHAIAVNDPWNNPRVDPGVLDAWQTRAYAILPIFGHERVIGVMLVDFHHHGRRVGRDDISRLLLFASAIGLATEKVTVIGDLEGKVEERTKALQAAHKKMTMLYQEARRSERVKSDYLASMSHELRTPLNSIIGFSKVMLKGMDGELNDAQRQDLTAIYQSGVHLLDLINDILDLSKIEAGKMELRREHFDLNEVVRDVIETSSILAQERELTLRHDLDTNLPFLYADKMRVRQILMNLVSNAIKFTDSGSVTIQTRFQDTDVFFSVIDTGRGMRKGEMDRAFQEFQQFSGKEGETKGSGLGLTICKRFVEMHGGKIWATSTWGVGSTFNVTIPITR